MEQKYHDSLEQIALLEAEISNHGGLQIDLQRTKDELRDTLEELAIANTKLDRLNNHTSSPDHHKTSTPTRSKTSRQDSLRKSGRFIFNHPGGGAAGIPENAEAAYDPLDASSSRLPPKQQMPRSPQGISASRSIRKIHGMLDQMKSLETRVANFKSSLPKPIPYTKHHHNSPLTSPTHHRRPSSRSSLHSRPSSRSSLHSHKETIQDSAHHQPPQPQSSSASPTSCAFPRPRGTNDFATKYSEDYLRKRHSLNYHVGELSPILDNQELAMSRSKSVMGHFSLNPSRSYILSQQPVDVQPPLSFRQPPPAEDRRLERSSFQALNRAHTTRDPRSQMSVDKLNLAGLVLQDHHPNNGPAPHPSASLLYSHSGNASKHMPQNTKHTNTASHTTKTKPSLTGFDAHYSNPFPHPMYNANQKPHGAGLSQTSPVGNSLETRPGSTFGMLHSRQTIGHGRMV